MSEKNKKKNVLFMAFATGQESKETAAGKKYIGIGSFNVLAVNPVKKELEDIYGITIENEPTYKFKSRDDKDGIRIDFLVKTVPEKNNEIDFITKVSYFIENAPRLNKDSTKVQVINEFGETAWIPVELAKEGKVPENMSWFQGPYRPAFSGEDALTEFLKVYLNVPYKSWRDAAGVVHTIENIEDAKARLESIQKYFTGDIAELKKVLKYQPDNKVKLCIGVKTTNEGKIYQDVFSALPMKYGVRDFTKLSKTIQSKKDSGAYANTEFAVTDLAEYSVEPTNFKSEAGAAPTAATTSGATSPFDEQEGDLPF